MNIKNILGDHGKKLGSVKDAASLSTWHREWAKAWGPNAGNLAHSANATFGLKGEKQIRDELGYLAVESRRSSEPSNDSHTWVLLSANPGWGTTNAHERTLKGQTPGDGAADLAQYDSFRTQFFPRWYKEVIKPHHPSKGMWWNLALNFLHRCAGLPAPAQMCERDPRLRVIGWELWPLHSTRDGLTGAMASRTELLEFARNSLMAATRFPSNGLVVASSAGFRLFDALDPGKIGLTLVHRGTIGGIQVRRYEHKDGRVVSVIRRQLFVGFVRADVLEALATWIQSGAAPVTAPVGASGASMTNGELYHRVTRLLGLKCACQNGSRRPCPARWHTWYQTPQRAIAFVHNPSHAAGKLLLNVPAGRVNSFYRAWQQGNLGDLPCDRGDDRNPGFVRYRLRPLDVKSHTEFLDEWIPKMMP